MHYLKSLSRFSILRCFKEKWFNFETKNIKTKNKRTEENLLEQMLNK